MLSSQHVMSILISYRLVSSLDLTPNSRNSLTRKCVAARGENKKSDLGN